MLIKAQETMGTKEYYLVYVVDDDPGYIEQLKDFLHRSIPAFLRIRSFNTIDECLQHIYQKPDLIFFEHSLRSLGEANGVMALQEIKRGYEDTPVVVLTRNDNLGAVVRCMRNGAYSYIIKNSEAFTHIGRLVKKMVDRVRAKRIIKTRKRRLAIISGAMLMLFISIILLLKNT